MINKYEKESNDDKASKRRKKSYEKNRLTSAEALNIFYDEIYRIFKKEGDNK